MLGSSARMSQDLGHNPTVTFIYCNLIMHWRKASWCRTCSGRRGRGGWGVGGSGGVGCGGVLSVFLISENR